MKRIQIFTGTCALIMIVFVLISGCAFLPGGNPTTQPATPPGNPDTPTTMETEVSQTCPEIGGNICLSDETCSGSLIKTTDSTNCCAGTCSLSSYTITPTPTDPGLTPTSTATPQPTQTTPQVITTVMYYVTAQQTMPGVTPTSDVQPQQTYETEVSKACEVIGGNICFTDETCSGSLIKTTDSTRCCAGTCIITSLATTPTVQATPAPVVVSKTCADFGGLICQATETCTGALVQSTDSLKCCAGSCTTP